MPRLEDGKIKLNIRTGRRRKAWKQSARIEADEKDEGEWPIQGANEDEEKDKDKDKDEDKDTDKDKDDSDEDEVQIWKVTNCPSHASNF